MAQTDGDLCDSDRLRSGYVETGYLEKLVVKWMGHFDALSVSHEPNCSIYWECASDLLNMIGCSQA